MCHHSAVVEQQFGVIHPAVCVSCHTLFLVMHGTCAHGLAKTSSALNSGQQNRSGLWLCGLLKALGGCCQFMCGACMCTSVGRVSASMA